jgi:hypothetical protein
MYIVSDSIDEVAAKLEAAGKRGLFPGTIEFDLVALGEGL